MRDLFAKKGFSLPKEGNSHAGGKWKLQYNNLGNQKDSISVDLNFMFRVPLFPIKLCDSFSMGSLKVERQPVLDEKELIAGKLTALFDRAKGRDFFDVDQISKSKTLSGDDDNLRIAVLVYGGMSKFGLIDKKIQNISLDFKEAGNSLKEVLRKTTKETTKDLLGRIEKSAKEYAAPFLDFKQNEFNFLYEVEKEGNICPELLTSDKELQERISMQPLLKWKCLNVKEHKKGKGITQKIRP